MLARWPSAPPHADSVMQCLIVMLTAAHSNLMSIVRCHSLITFPGWVINVRLSPSISGKARTCHVTDGTHDSKCTYIARVGMWVDRNCQQNGPSASHAFGEACERIYFQSVNLLCLDKPRPYITKRNGLPPSLWTRCSGLQSAKMGHVYFPLQERSTSRRDL